MFLSRRGADERDALYVMNPDGTQVTALTQFSSIDGGNFNLLYPDTHYMNAAGTRFLLTFDFGTDSGSTNILVNADGTGATNISTLLDPAADTSGTVPYGHVSDVGMKADASKYVFPYTTFTSGSTFAPGLVTMNADGSARTTRYSATNDQQIMSPIFAPDGQTIYFVQGATNYNVASPYPFTGGIYRLAAGAATPTLVASLTTVGSSSAVDLPSISISPDGAKLTFPNNVSGLGDEIFTVNTDGTGLKQLTTAAAVNDTPAFTDDGTKILFVSYRDGNAEIYNINPGGTGETRLTYQVEPDTQPATRAAAKRAAWPRSRRATVGTSSSFATNGKATR